MVKVMKFFYKNGFGKRVLSMTMAFLMLFTMFAGQLPEGLLEVKAAENQSVTLHWDNSAKNWTTVNAYVWTEDGGEISAGWPGTVATANVDNANWYDYTVADAPTDTLKFIFNDGSSQTDDLNVGITEDTTDVWVQDGGSTITTTAPTGWVVSADDSETNDSETNDSEVTSEDESEAQYKTITFYYKNAEGCDWKYGYAWYNTDKSLCGGWPGTIMTLDSSGEYYTVTSTELPADVTSVYFIATDNSAGQTADVIIDLSGFAYGANGYEILIMANSSNSYTECTVRDKNAAVVNDKEVTFRYYAPDATSMHVAGSFNEWSADAFALTKGDDGVWTGTTTLAPGSYEYKFIISGGWESGDNRTFVVEGLCGATAEGTKSEEITLPETLVYYDADGNESNVAVTYAVADEADADYVSITGNKLTVATTYTEGTIDLIATGNNASATVTVTLHEKLYTYTIYVYSETASRMTTDASVIYIWDAAEETTLEAADYEFTGTEELSDGNTWLKTEVKLGCSENLGLIFKSKGSWSWQTDNMYFVNADKADCTLYIVDGDATVYESLEDIVRIPEVENVEVDGTSVTFNYYAPDATSMHVAGSFNGWTADAFALTKGDDGVWTGTITLSPGSYEFKFIISGGWETCDNRPFVVSGLCGATAEGTMSEEITLPETLVYYDADGNESNVTVTYAVADEADADYVTINGNKLTVKTSYTEGTIDLIATGNNASATVTVTLHDKLYTYTIYVYSKTASRMATDASAMHIWDAAEETTLEAADYLFTGTEELSDGNTWLKAEVKLGCSEKLGLIFKSKGSWSWQTDNMYFVNADKADCTLYIVDGDTTVYESLDDVEIAPDIVSPEVNGNEVTFRYYNKEAATVYLAGSMTNWADGKKAMTETDEPGVFELTVELEPGRYEYKFIWENETSTNNWVTDPLNVKTFNSNSAVYVAGLVDTSVTVLKGSDVTFPATLTYWNEDGTTDDLAVTYSLVDTEYAGYVVINANSILVGKGCDAKTLDFTATATLEDGTKVTATVTANLTSVISPEVNGNEVTFRYANEDAVAVYLAGSMTDWATGKKEMTKNADGVFEITVELETGAHEYKFIMDTATSTENWVTDGLNDMYIGDNSAVYVAGILDGSASVVRGEATEISATQKYLNLDGTKTDVAVTYTVADETLADVVTIDGNKITVAADSDVTSVALTATTADGATATVTVSVTEPGEEPVVVVSPEVNGFEVTFRYQSDTATSVNLAGSMNGWSMTETPMTKGENNVFEVTLTLEAGTHEYKFVIDGKDWVTDPLNTADLSTGGNSVVKVENPIEVVSPEVDGKYVTFRYYSETATAVYLAGSMTEWATNKQEMTGTDGLYEIKVELGKGSHEYKFIYDTATSTNNWVTDPSNDMTSNGNSVVYMPGLLDGTASVVRGEETEISATQQFLELDGTKTDVEVTYTLVAVTYEDYIHIDGNKITVDAECEAESFILMAQSEAGDTANILVTVKDADEEPVEVVSPEVNGFEVTFRYQSDTATSVYLAGSMTDWDTNKKEMTKDENGVFTVTVTLEAGTYQYKFVVDGNWILDPLNENKADDGYGGSNSLVVVENPVAIVSPEVKDNEVTFRYYSESATKVYLAGSMNGWSTDSTPLTKGEDNVFTYTTTLAPGKYEYKFVVDGNWMQDPSNTMTSGDNSAFVVYGLCDGTFNATRGETNELPVAMEQVISMVNSDYEVIKVAVTYTLDDETLAEYVTIDGQNLTISSDYTGTGFTLTATTAAGLTAEMKVAVYDKQYTYTIYAYSENADRMSTDAAALWFWDKAGETSTAAAEIAFTGTETLSDGNTWLKTEVTVGFAKELGMIFKSKGSWSWQTSDLIFENTAKTDCTLYIVDGKNKVYTSLDDIYNEPEEEVRYLVVEYTRDDNDYTDTNVYSWANGFGEEVVPFENINGKYIAKVPVTVSEAEMSVGFIVRKGTDWDTCTKDGGDNFAVFPVNQDVVKVKFHDAKVTYQYPYNVGSEFDRANEALAFYYRDDALFLEDTLASLAGKVQVVVKSSTGNTDIDGTHDMTYSIANARFTANVPLVDDTDYYYYYLVDGVKVMDAYNEKTLITAGEEYNVVRNRTYELDITASIKNASMDYNDNNLLYVTWAPKEGENLEGFVVSELYADLSELGLGKMAIDPALKTVAIACDESVPSGAKDITVVLVDDCGAEYKTTTSVTVTERTKTANTDEKLGDFDWDEAVIYFAVTDRFYDGNTANNTATEGYDAADTTDNSRYHGGDLTGLTEKIDYLYDLGVNTIWLTPIVDNVDQNVREAESATDGQESYGYHGYWASDFTSLNPHLGTEAELKALVDAAHAKGMKVMVDVVLNHAGYETEDTFNTIITDAEGNYINMIRGNDETVDGDDKLDSLSGLPDFMTENEEVRNQLIEWQTTWMEEFDIDYYRVDTVKHVDNTTWAAFKNALTEIDPEFKLIGEYYGASYSSTAGQLDSGKMDSLLDFGFKDYAREFVFGNLSSVEAKLAERNGVLDNTSTLGSFLSSHDENGFLYTLKNSTGNAALAEGLMKVASTLQITAKGQPVIYYGEEIGLSGANNYPLQENRYDFDWEALATQEADENSLYNHYKTMLNIRRDYSEIFAKGDRGIAAISDSEGYEVINRSYEGENLYVAMNIKDAAKEATFFVTGIPGSVYTDVYSGAEYTVTADGKVTITIPKATEGGTAVLILTEGENAVIEDTNTVTVKLHYNRPDGDYTDWNVWFWADGMGGSAYEFVEENGDMVATVTVEGRSENAVNYIVRKGEWEAKDVDADQSIDISDIVSGTVHFYVNAGVPGGTRILGADAIKGSKIISSMYDRETNTVTVEVSAPSSVDKNKVFTITRSDGKVIEIASVALSGNTYTLVLKDDISSLMDVLKSYTLRYEDFDYGLGMPNLYASEEFESQFTYDGDDLGATWTAEATIFKVWAPTADDVKVALYASGTEGTDDLLGTYAMTLGEKGVWSVIIDGDLNGVYYTYLVDVNGEVEEACDPYARTTGVNGKRAMVIDLDSTNPEGWDEDVSPNKGMEYTDAVIYELHVRDASIHESSGVSAENKGKFLGLTETGTTTDGGVSTVLDHISDLGVTHVHLLPVYDYGSVDETKLDTPQFNWGYDPVNYNVPEGSYSTDPYNGATRVEEMKEMVMALHENNINVVMDVVYNHVYDAENFCFNEIVPKYFSRTYADGSYSSGSGCGNDTASERAMVQKYIIDSVMYWAEEYHIDGFRFDLVGLIDADTMNGVIEAVHEKYPDVIFYGEGWTMATETSKDVSMSTQANAYLTPELAYFSDTIRNLLAGDNSATNVGFVSGLTGQESLLSACVTAKTSWCPSPTQTVNYASCHDNYTLKDKLNITRSEASEEDRIKMNNLAASVYMMSQGIPFIHAGEEFLRTKVHEDGTVEHNSYNSSDYVNALRWNNLEDETYADVADYYKGLIEFRKNHEALRLTTSEEVSANMSYHWVDSNVVLFSLKGKDSVEGEVSDGIVVIFNATEEEKTFSLYNYDTIAEGEWKVCINAEDAGIEVLDTITDGNVTVAPISAMVLVMGETEDTDSVYIDNYREPSQDDDDDNQGSTGGSGSGSGSTGSGSGSTGTTTPEDSTTGGSTGSITETTKPGTGTTEDETDDEEIAEGPVEIIIPVDGSVEEKTDAIVEAIEEVEDGNDVIVKVIDAESGEALVSIEVITTLEDNKDKDVELVIELANGFTWTIDANSVDTSKLEAGLAAINFWVEIVEEVVPEELISDVVPENAEAIEISLKHNGPFGLTAALDVPVGNEYAGRMATLYYFNAEANALEAQATEKIGEDGDVRFLFTHASDYVLVIEGAAEEVVETTETVDSETTENTEVVDGTTDNAEEGGSGMTIVLVLLVLVLLIVGVVLLKKKKTA